MAKKITPKGATPELETEIKDSEAPGFTPDPEPQDDALLGLLSEYAAAYPEDKVFYVTSDNQVFLKSNKADAYEHQKTLDKTIEVKVFEV